MRIITETIIKAKYNYESDCTGYFETTINKNICHIIWGKNENNQYTIDEFSICKKGKWIESSPTEEEKELMFKMLDKIPDRKEELYSEPDDYDNLGLKRADFF